VIRSRESAIVGMIPFHALAVRLETQRAAEIAKGCERTIWPQPVALEPPYMPMYIRRRTEEPKQVLATYENGFRPEDLVRLQIWMSPERAFEWTRCESFLKQLSGVSHRLLFEIAGNRDGVSFRLGCHREDLPIVQIAFEAKIEHCIITLLLKGYFDSALASYEIRMRDYLPMPRYHRLLTRPEELKDSPYEGLIAALVKLSPPAIGLYQVIFQPVSPMHDWHQNVQCLTDLEYSGAQISYPTLATRFPQQSPSNALHPTADKLESKAHNDKPFFATAVRVALTGSADPANELLALTTPMSLFQHGGQRLWALTEADYAKVLSPREIHQMLSRGLTYRPGFLVNSDELTGLVHVPPTRPLERWESALNLLDPFSAAEPNLSEGLPIGVATVAGSQQVICISPRIQRQHIRIVARSDMGKSSLMESMILYHIQQGYGVAVLDPHGDLVARLLTLIPKETVARTIYFKPGDPDWIPLWNPLARVSGQDIGRTADDLVAALKSFVTGWGDRLEHILRHGIFALMHLEHTSFLDLLDLLRTGTNESKELKELLLQVVQDEPAQKFWRHDYEKYRADEFGPARHKLRKLLVGGSHALMLSQPYSRFSFRHMMDDGMIFLGDLCSGLGTRVRNALGGFQVASVYGTALGRSDTPRERRKPFYVYMDEAQRFVTDCLEDMLVETRKFGVHLILAHQHLRQFTADQANALAGVGSTIAFNVGEQDADHLARIFPEKVKGRDFLTLEDREALVRIGTAMTKIRTRDRPATPDVNYRDEIIEQSHDRYCLPVGAVRELIRRRHRGRSETFSPLVPGAGKAAPDGQPPARLYDEL